MTEEEIKKKYGYDVEVLREAINDLLYKKNKTEEENALLEDLQLYRTKYHKDDKLAYYDTFEISTLFDFKTTRRD